MKWLYRTSIHTRLMVISIGIILVGFSLLTVVAGGQISTAARVDYEQQLQEKTRLVAQNIGATIGNQDISRWSDSEKNSLLAKFSREDVQLTLYTLNQPLPGVRERGGRGSTGP